MNKASVKFFGKKHDEYGMPIPFHSYLILASPWNKQGSGFAEAVVLSSETPELNPSVLIVQDGGPSKAVDNLIGKLRELPENAGLQELIYRGTWKPSDSMIDTLVK